MRKMSALLLALTFPLALMASDEKDAYSGNDFWYYDKMDRVKIFQSLMDSIEIDYALLPIKQERLGLNFKQLNEETLRFEEGTPLETDSFAQAKSNIRFIDRVKAYVAKFQDTHFSIGPTTPMPVIYTGIKVTEVNGKILVTSLDSKILSYIANRSGIPTFKSVAIGDELVKVDGKPVRQAINDLTTFIGASSPGYTMMRAVNSLAIRTFNYPDKNYVDFTFANGTTLRFPWFYSTSGIAVRPDVNFFFKQLGFINDASVELNWDNVKKDWVESTPSYAGYSATAIQGLLTDVKNYSTAQSGLVIRTGYFSKEGKKYGVLQLTTFVESKVKDAEGKDQSFLDVIGNFILQLKQQNLPLIFDLRNNNGGNGNFPPAILSFLTETGKIYANKTSAYKITEYMRQLQEPDFFKDFPADSLSTGGITNDEFMNAFQTAVRERAVYTPMMSFNDITPSPLVDGYEQKIVALVTPNCVSACDNMTNVLKNNHRALIIGTHSNGTGAGFSSDSRLNTNWTDPRHVLSTTFPNYVFGLPGGAPGTYVFEKDSAWKLCSENRPHMADIKYSTQLIDITSGNLGWFNKAVEVLEQN